MCCGKDNGMNYPHYEDGVLSRYLGKNYGVRTIEGGEGRTYAGGQAAPRQYVHPDDVELLKSHFKPLIEQKKRTAQAEVVNVEATAEPKAKK